MDTQIQLFKFEAKSLRTVTDENNEPWFVARDVCEFLAIDNPAQAVSRLDDDEKNTIILNEGIGNPTTLIVSEAGLYSLVLGSRKPEAKAFKRWVTHEVLPQIRKTGRYGLPASHSDEIQALRCMGELIANMIQVKEENLAHGQKIQVLERNQAEGIRRLEGLASKFDNGPIDPAEAQILIDAINGFGKKLVPYHGKYAFSEAQKRFKAKFGVTKYTLLRKPRLDEALEWLKSETDALRPMNRKLANIR